MHGPFSPRFLIAHHPLPFLSLLVIFRIAIYPNTLLTRPRPISLLTLQDISTRFVLSLACRSPFAVVTLPNCLYYDTSVVQLFSDCLVSALLAVSSLIFYDRFTHRYWTLSELRVLRVGSGYEMAFVPMLG